MTLSVLGELMASCVVKRLFSLESSTLHIGMLSVSHMDRLLQLIIFPADMTIVVSQLPSLDILR